MKLKRLVWLVVFCSVTVCSQAQKGEKYFNKGNALLKADKYEAALKQYNKCLALEPDVPGALYNRGYTQMLMQHYPEAEADFSTYISLEPSDEEAILLRGLIHRYQAHYTDAMADFNAVLEQAPASADGYYHRGRLHALLGEEEAACSDFEKSARFGSERAVRQVKNSNDTSRSEVYLIPYLRQAATDKNYGYTPEQPIKVGNGPDGGPANQHAYIELLRDGQGRPVSYVRLGSCCPYPSENGLFGSALVDRYQLTYKNEKGKTLTTVLYISFYDYQQPLVPVGFTGLTGKR